MYASGAASLYIFNIGVRAGLEASIFFNLNDSPNPNGKLYIEEIVNKLPNPICPFDVSGRLDVFLSAFVETDLFLFSKEFTIEIIRPTLLEFSAACTPPPPIPATGFDAPDPEDPDGVSDDLRINIGPNSTARNFALDETEEEEVVRQLTPAPCGGATRVSVIMSGFYDEYDVPAGGVIYADLGDDQDQISFLPFQPSDVNGQPVGDIIPFQVVVIVFGGDGNDNIKGGECRDFLRGGNHDDKIDGGGGDGDIDGNDGADQLNGALGEDDVNGGPDDDHLDGGSGISSAGTNNGNDTLIGGAGMDTLIGGAGNDTMYGDENLGAFTATACNTAGAITGGDNSDVLQGGEGNDDRLVGNMGDDIACGNSGDDTLFGDNEDAETASDGNDELHGGPDNDTLYGFGGEDQLFGDSGGGNAIVDRSDPWVVNSFNGAITRTLVFADVGSTTVNNAAGTPDAGTSAGDHMFGEGSDDTMYGQGGDDEMNGDEGSDHMFGDNQDDDMWGGFDYDQMDLRPRTDESDRLADPDPVEWYVFGFEDPNPDCVGNLEDVDYLYGGWDADVMLANVGDNDTRIGDRLIDWIGVHNLYILCPATYGEFVITREFSPQMTEFIHSLAKGDGAFEQSPRTQLMPLGSTNSPSL